MPADLLGQTFGAQQLGDQGQIEDIAQIRIQRILGSSAAKSFVKFWANC